MSKKVQYKITVAYKDENKESLQEAVNTATALVSQNAANDQIEYVFANGLAAGSFKKALRQNKIKHTAERVGA